MRKGLLFVIIAIALIGGALYVQSQNDQQAQAKAAHIVELDTAGTDTAAARSELKAFAANHLGVDVGYTLGGAYRRAEEAARAAAAATATNSQIYADAQRLCSGKSDSITQARCNQDYLAKHLAAVPNPTPVPAPKLSDYQFQVRSPRWTPDVAGSLWLGAAVAVVAAFIMPVTGRRRGR